MRQMGGDFGGLSGLPLHSGDRMSWEKFLSAAWGRLETTDLADTCRAQSWGVGAASTHPVMVPQRTRPHQEVSRTPHPNPQTQKQ